MNKNTCMGCMSDTGGENICPVCGYDNTSRNSVDHLSIKSVLAGRYIIGMAYDINGEGVSYNAWDESESKPVIVREYFPSDIASRNPDGSVKINGDYALAYNNGLLEFLEIGQKLARNNHLPCVFKTENSFEYGGTAYRICESVSGISLMEFLLRNGGSLTWDQARPLFLPLISTLSVLHEARIYHRGISPETIFVGRDGKLRLKNISIKSVRTRDNVITSQLYPGFAAVEQYGIDGISYDGPQTDVYGLSATLFRVLAGNPPCDATERLDNDNMAITAKVAQTVPKHVLAALANGLQVMPSERTQSILELREELSATNEAKVVNSVAKKHSKNSSNKYALIAAGCTAAIFIIIAGILVFANKDKLFPKNDTSTASVMSEPPQSNVGDVEGTFEEKENKVTVPAIEGMDYDDAVKQLTDAHLKVEVIGKEYSDSVSRGMIIKQSAAPGKEVKAMSVINLTISLGSKNVKVPDIRNKEKDAGYISLLETGFLKNNIEFIDKYDDTAEPGVVLSTDPAVGTEVIAENKIKVYINSYKGETEGEEFDNSIQ